MTTILERSKRIPRAPRPPKLDGGISLTCPAMGCCLTPFPVACAGTPYEFPRQFQVTFYFSYRPINTDVTDQLWYQTGDIQYLPKLVNYGFCFPQFQSPPVCLDGVNLGQYNLSPNCGNTGTQVVGPIQFIQAPIPDPYNTAPPNVFAGTILGLWNSQGSDYFGGTAANLPWAQWQGLGPPFTPLNFSEFFLYDWQGYFSVPNPHRGCVTALNALITPGCVCDLLPPFPTPPGWLPPTPPFIDPKQSLAGYYEVGDSLGLSICFILTPGVEVCLLWCFIYVIDLKSQYHYSQGVTVYDPIVPIFGGNPIGNVTFFQTGEDIGFGQPAPNGKNISALYPLQGGTGAFYCLNSIGLSVGCVVESSSLWFGPLGSDVDALGPGLWVGEGNSLAEIIQQGPDYRPPTCSIELLHIYVASLSGGSDATLVLGYEGGCPFLADSNCYCTISQQLPPIGPTPWELLIQCIPGHAPTAQFPVPGNAATIVSTNPLVITGSFGPLVPFGPLIFFTITEP